MNLPPKESAGAASPRETLQANRALEPTRNGWSLQAFISFWAFRAQPQLAAQLQRWASDSPIQEE